MGLGAWTLALRLCFKVQASLKYINYDSLSVTTARAEHYTFLQSSNERGNNSDHKKAISNLRRL